MKNGLGIFIWKISVALYLIANGILGLQKWSGGDFMVIFRRMNFTGNTLDIFVAIASVIAFIAGIALILEIFDIKISFLETLILIVAIIWAVYVTIEIISWITGGFKDFWYLLQMLAIHLMVLGSLLAATRKFG